MNWQLIETAPKNTSVLVVYQHQYRKQPSIIKAIYIPQYTDEAGEDNDNHEYCEADDTYYIPAGWYELIENWEDWGSVQMCTNPTHWMSMPDLPKEIA